VITRAAIVLACLGVVACEREQTGAPPINPTQAVSAAVPDVLDAGPIDANADLATVDGSLADPDPSFYADAGAPDAAPIDPGGGRGKRGSGGGRTSLE